MTLKSSNGASKASQLHPIDKTKSISNSLTIFVVFDSKRAMLHKLALPLVPCRNYVVLYDTVQIRSAVCTQEIIRMSIHDILFHIILPCPRDTAAELPSPFLTSVLPEDICMDRCPPLIYLCSLSGKYSCTFPFLPEPSAGTAF